MSKVDTPAWKQALQDGIDGYGIYAPRKQTHHIIDGNGEITYCEKFSAWNTANPDYARSTRKRYPDTRIVKLDKRDLDHSNICKTCASRYYRGVCDTCKKALNKHGVCKHCENIFPIKQ